MNMNWDVLFPLAGGAQTKQQPPPPSAVNTGNQNGECETGEMNIALWASYGGQEVILHWLVWRCPAD